MEIVEVRVSITTKEVADRFGKVHRDVMKSARKLVELDSVTASKFKKSSYLSPQNKEIQQFEMSIEGFCLLTDTWSFSRGESAPIKSEILSEFGEKFSIVGSIRTRPENDFYDYLKSFFSLDKIIRQYPIAGFKVDFYMPAYSIFIEYDEDHHFSKKARFEDMEREVLVRDYFKSEFDDEVNIIRVSKGEEMQGLARIMAEITLITNNGEGCTKYRDGEA